MKDILKKWWFWLIVVIVLIIITKTLFFHSCSLLAYGDDSGMPTGTRNTYINLFEYLIKGCPE